MSITIQEIYGDSAPDDDSFYDRLDRSLNPRNPDMLYDKLNDQGLGPASRLIDAGCRDGRYTCELARRYGCRVTGIDLVTWHLVEARKKTAGQGLGDQVLVAQGDLLSLPLPEASFDAVWCRDVLGHLPDLFAAMCQFARVLRPGGLVLIYNTFATSLLEPEEASRLFAALAVQPASADQDHFEAAASAAGFRIVEKDVVSSEWREYWEECGDATTSRQLLRIARMRRDKEALMAAVGSTYFEIELANYHWGVYQMLGKLCPIVYILALSQSDSG